MAIVGRAPILDEHVGMGLKERDQLLVRRDGPVVEHASRGLVDHLRDARKQRDELRAESIPRGRRGEALQMRERAGGVARRARTAKRDRNGGRID